MTTVRDIADYIQTLAPSELACSWDNNGLLAGFPEKEVSRVLVALDPFEAVAEEAAVWGAEVIVTHHPLIFEPLKSITDGDAKGRTLIKLLQSGISAVNAHTSLDIAQGGVNDCLAQKLGLQDVRSIGEEKLLRMGTVSETELSHFLRNVKNALGCPTLRYADGGKPCRRIAVGGGACGSDWTVAAQAMCDTFVTADVKYNQFWDARDAGLTIIDAGHFYTENPVCEKLCRKLAEKFPSVEVKISEVHRDCMKFFG